MLLSIISTTLVLMALWEGYCELSMRLLLIAYIVKWLQCALMGQMLNSIMEDEGD